jgi:hypothetical protein
LTATVLDRRERLHQFHLIYEDLVEVICDAGNYGPTSALCARYSDLTDEYMAAYGEVQAFLEHFLEPAVSLRQPFMRLAVRSSLTELIETDSGALIPDIMATRGAIVAYAHHLSQVTA